jgi:hypothetical protein
MKMSGPGVGMLVARVLFGREPQRRLRTPPARSPFAGTRLKNAGRIAPERLGERVAQIGTVETDIRKHVGIEAGEDPCMPAMPEDAREPADDCRK